MQSQKGGEAGCKGGERLSVPRAQQLLKPHPTPRIQWCYIHTHWVGTTSNRPTLLGTGPWAQMAGPSCALLPAAHILKESDPLASGRETPRQGCLGYARRCFPAAWRWVFFPAGCLHKSQDRKGKGWEGAQATLWRSAGQLSTSKPSLCRAQPDGKASRTSLPRGPPGRLGEVPLF